MLYRKQLITSLNYHTKIGSSDTVVCLFMVRSIDKKCGYRKSILPDHLWSYVGPHARTKFIIIAGSAYGKHEMPATELSNDDVKSEVEVSAVSARESTCGSHRQTCIGTYFSTFIS